MKIKGTVSTFVIVSLMASVSALLMASCQQQPITSLSPVPGTSPSPTAKSNVTPSPASSSKVVSKKQAAQIFFDAYKVGDRESALQVATDEVVNSLRWDPSAGTNPTLELSGEDFIYYEGGGINLRFEGDAQQGYKIVEAQAIAD